MANEKNFENKVKNFLKNNNCYYIKYWGGGEFTKAGIPDILACCNGVFLGIEIKAPNGKPSPLQIHNIKLINKAGGIGLLLYPNDFDDFKQLIQRLERDESVEHYKEFFNSLLERWERKLRLK